MKDYVEELAKLENHLIEHPADYQSKVQYMILRSRQTDYEFEQAMNMRSKRIAEIRRELKETADEQECKQ